MTNMKNKLRLVIFFIFIFTLSLIMFIGGYRSLLKVIYPIKYENIVNEVSKEYNVKSELIYAIIKTESGFDEKAKSSAGALGLMQITPETFEWLKKNKKGDGAPEEILNPNVNIRYGVFFLSILIEKYRSEFLVLCAYNAGMSAVDRWIKEGKISESSEKIDLIPYRETRKYVKRVKNSKETYKMLYF